MARPLRRVLIGLSIRIGIGVAELEQYQVHVIREYLAMLGEINKPASARAPAPGFSASQQQTPEQMMAAAGAALGHLKG